METNQTIGERIKTLRERKNLTQLELSKGINVKRETINQWENGTRDLKTGTIISLSKYFNVSADYILGLSDISHRNYEDLICDHTELTYKVNNFKEWFERMAEYVKNNL